MFSADETLNILTTCGIPVIDPSTNYWFIRTNGGDNFENFWEYPKVCVNLQTDVR